MTDLKYKTMKEIGVQVGATSHAIGKKLKQLGYRTDAGKPSKQAFDEELVGERWTPDRLHYAWAWDAEKVIPLLEQSDLKRKDE